MASLFNISLFNITPEVAPLITADAVRPVKSTFQGCKVRSPTGQLSDRSKVRQSDRNQCLNPNDRIQLTGA